MEQLLDKLAWIESAKKNNLPFGVIQDLESDANWHARLVRGRVIRYAMQLLAE